MMFLNQYSHAFKLINASLYKIALNSVYYKQRITISNTYINQLRWISCSSSLLQENKSIPNSAEKNIEVIFIRANGEKIRVKGKKGDSLLDLVVNENLDFDGYGACEGTLTCSTCHVVLKAEDFEKIPDKITDEESDMLDLAFDVTETSRLGCQIILTDDLNGLEVHLPNTINDARS